MTADELIDGMIGAGRPFSSREYTIVPNVSWGWGLDYEADIIAISPAGTVNEIEVKVRQQDLLNDVRKRKWGCGLDPRVKRFWYAVPPGLAALALEIRPDPRINPGVLVVRAPDRLGEDHDVKIARPAKAIQGARQATPSEVQELSRLGLLRYWDLRVKRWATIPT